MISLENNFAEQGLTNLGLQDVVLALEWVQKNINSFGGDPAKVTFRSAMRYQADRGRSLSAGSQQEPLCGLSPNYGQIRNYTDPPYVDTMVPAEPQFLMSGSPSLAIQNGTGLVDTMAKPAWSNLLKSVGCGDSSDIVTCLRTVNGTELLETQTTISETSSP